MRHENEAKSPKGDKIMRTLLNEIKAHRDFAVAFNYLVHDEKENFKDWFKFRFKHEALTTMEHEGYEWYEVETFINDVHFHMRDELVYEVESARDKLRLVKQFINNPEMWEEALNKYQYEGTLGDSEANQVYEALRGLGL